MESVLEKSWKKALESDLEHISNELKEILVRPSLVILSGEMGAGKTSFVKKCLPKENISSPTYSIINDMEDYIHADFYRIENQSEIEYLELEYILEDKEYVFIEWGRQFIDVIMRYLPTDFNVYELQIKLNDAAKGEEKQKTISRNYELYRLIFQ